ncbi:hypothetical protein TEA_010188 [Camellia sinensis var. sinensis]|uniref:3-hydroxyisobutyryl-CoA hydrolase n=1 Tax=Camellia sinensis var. sinensis TaxID=542762 RepID=A0A4S4DUA0_CAMSN|nr:hypothetical protein TEA_010188 [Camellia sinensis var. sinensis]
MEPINSSKDNADQVLVEENSHGIKVLLNRPNQLNALSFQMISRILELFLACEEDCNVKLIILKGKGRAFSSGGDVSAVVRDITKGNWKFGAKYFQKEYILNYVIATYSKPQVSILNGIVMGGGAGASIHGRFRVATENSDVLGQEGSCGDGGYSSLERFKKWYVLVLFFYQKVVGVVDKAFSW